MLHKVLRNFKWISLLYVGNGVSQIIFASLSVVWFQRMLDQIPVSSALKDVMTPLWFYGAFTLLAYLLDYFDEYPMRILSNGIYHKLKLMAVAKVSRIDFQAYQSLGTGRLIQLVENGADAGRQMLFEFWLKLFRELIPGMAVGLLFIGAYDRQIMVYLGLGYVLVAAVSGLLLRMLYKLKSRVLVEQEDLSRFSVRSFMEMVVFRTNKRFARELDRITRHSNKIVKIQAGIRMIHELFFVLFAIIVLVIKLVIVYVGFRRVSDGLASIGYIVALTTFADRIFSPIAILNVRFIDYKLNKLTFKRFEDFMNLPEDHGLTRGREFVPGAGTVRFDRVSFKYEGLHHLEDLAFSIQGGSSVALVGASGAGKSTTVKLMLGLLKPGLGTISIDNQELTTLNLNTYYDHISYVSQDAPVFDGSLRENIVFDKAVPDDDIMQVLHRLGLDALLSRLPAGLDTEVGERGTKLSGGERQRLALARVMFQDPVLVILDEPTSALDGITEEQVTSAMLEMLQGKTVVIVAHRLKTIAGVQEVLVLDRGKLAERGSCAQLLENGGLFRKLWDKQAVSQAG